MTEIERLFVAAKGFSTTLIHFLAPHYIIISNVHICSFTCTISYMHGCAPKIVLGAPNLMYDKL